MKVLFFDTETTGFSPRNATPCISNIKDWPYILQLAFILYDTDTNKIIINNNLLVDVNKYNVVIPKEATNVNGITNQQCKEHGLPIDNVLNCFLYCVHSCDMVVAHNMDYDWNMINAEILRQLLQDKSKMEKNLVQNVPKIIKYCTMKNSVDLCKIEMSYKYSGDKYFKYPKQEELHTYLFGVVPKNLHDALNDTLVCMRCFYKMWYNEDILEKCAKVKTMYSKML